MYIKLKQMGTIVLIRENMKKHPEALIEGIAQLATREMGFKEEARVLSNNAIKDDYADVDEIQVKVPFLLHE